MLPSSKNASGTNAKVQSKREQKKGINIRWNSRLIFQISLIGCLLLTFLIMESNISLGSGYDTPRDEVAFAEDPLMTNYVIYRDKVVEEKPKVKKRTIQKKITTVIEVKENDENVVETKTTPTSVNKEPDGETKQKTEAPVMPDLPGTIFEVDEIPAFPGCEGFTMKEERLACFSSKIRAFIGRKFNTNVMPDGLIGERQRINVQFTVDANGNIADIKARAPGKELEREATRVISKLPKMKPARKANKNVGMIYQIPIVVQTQD